MLYKMTALLRFNRDINKDIDYISPGSYTITLKSGQTCMFDFMQSRKYHRGILGDDSDDVLCIEVEELDRSVDKALGTSIPISKLTPEMVENHMVFFQEFYVYTGEDHESSYDLKLKSILECTLYFEEDGQCIEVTLTEKQRRFLND